MPVPTRTKLAGELVTVETRHPYVEQGGVRLEFLSQIKCRRTIECDAHLVTLKAQQHRHTLGKIRIVIGDKDSLRDRPWDMRFGCVFVRSRFGFARQTQHE